MNRPHLGDVDVSGTFLEPPPGLDPDCLLFLGDPTRRTYTAFGRPYYPTAGAIAFGLFSLLGNHIMRVPYRAGIQRHLWNAAIGGALGEGAWRWNEKRSAEKDLQFYHYMVMHPEDFQAPQRKKYEDVLEPWIPCR